MRERPPPPPTQRARDANIIRPPITQILVNGHTLKPGLGMSNGRTGDGHAQLHGTSIANQTRAFSR
eukprot:1798692-Pyramimonas_sp.AAC.1